MSAILQNFFGVFSDTRIREVRLLAFIAYLFWDHKFSPSSVTSCLAGIRSKLMEVGVTVDIFTPAVKRAIRAVRLGTDAPRQKLPITADILRDLSACYNSTLPDDAVHWACCSVAFYGLFRLGELLPADPERRLHWRQISFAVHIEAGPYVSIKITRSKSDPFGAGATIHLPCVADITCPLCALQRLHVAASASCSAGTEVANREVFACRGTPCQRACF
jgi:hypothetical protein